MNRLFDLRTVIGLFFLVVGLLLLGYSFVGHSADAINSRINRSCGIVFVLFACCMLFLSFVKKEQE